MNQSLRTHTYSQTLVRPRNRRLQLFQILLALAVLAALVLTRPANPAGPALAGDTPAVGLRIQALSGSFSLND